MIINHKVNRRISKKIFGSIGKKRLRTKGVRGSTIQVMWDHTIRNPDRKISKWTRTGNLQQKKNQMSDKWGEMLKFKLNVA